MTVMPSKATGQGTHTMAERGPDLYPTPPAVTRALLGVERLPRVLWEPAAGMGHMAAVLVEAGHEVIASDLHDYGRLVPGSPRILTGVDFLSAGVEAVRRARWEPECIVTNPPFSLAAEFVRVGLSISPRVCILARLAFLEGSGRADILDRHLARAYVFVNRLPMMHRHVPDETGQYVEWPGKKSTSAMAFAWMVFEANHDPRRGCTLRRVRWQHESDKLQPPR